jgi:ATP-dependent DNA ligase
MALQKLLQDIEAPVLYGEHLIGDGQEMFEHAAKLNWEGIVSKNPDAPYRSDRNEAWLKIKTVQKGSFPVVGFVKNPTGVAALYLGRRDERPRLHGQSRDRLVADCLKPDQKAARYGSEPEIQAH